MTHLSIQGNTLDVTPEAFVEWATATLISPLEFVSMLHWAQYFAMPGRSVGYGIRMIESAIRQIEENITIIDNAPFAQLMKENLPILKNITNTAQGIREWQQHEIPRKLIAEHNASTRVNGPHEPAWHDRPEFEKRLERFSFYFSQYLDIVAKAVPVLKDLVPQGPSGSLKSLERVQNSIPDLRMILEVGYSEAIRRKASI